MQVEIKIDSSCEEPKVLILTASMTEDVEAILENLRRFKYSASNGSRIISGVKDGKLEVLEQGDLIRIYANDGKVFAVTEKGEYVLRQRLYELEERLDAQWFVRISHSEIIHLKKVDHFDLSFTGTICVKLADGTTTYVSRRYVSKIKKILGV